MKIMFNKFLFSLFATFGFNRTRRGLFVTELLQFSAQETSSLSINKVTRLSARPWRKQSISLHSQRKATHNSAIS